MNLIRRELPDLIGTPVGGQKKTDAYGCEFIYAYAIQATVLNTPYTLDYGKYGPQAKTVNVTALTVRQIMIADEVIATGAYGWFALKGPHEVLVALTGSASANDGIIMDGSGAAVSDTVRDNTSVDTFAYLLETHATGAAVTSLCYLTGEPVTYA